MLHTLGALQPEIARQLASLTRWEVREYDAYVDVFNTTRKYPVAEGETVRSARIGGALLERTHWQAITVQ